jgi:hypothetical protein
MSAIGWNDGSWDRCILGDDALPGIVRVTVDTSRDVQQVVSPGVDAPSLKDQGFRGATVSIEWEVWSEQGGRDLSKLNEAQRILAKLSPRRPGGVKEPVAIVHPATALAGVTHIYSASYTIPPIKGGRLVIPIKALEWFPPEETTKPAQQAAAPPAGGGANAQAGAAGGGGAGAAGMGDGGPLGDGSVPPADPENLGADFA